MSEMQIHPQVLQLQKGRENMELIDILRVVRRWLWLIVAVVIVTELALWLGMRSAEPVYATTVSLQISTPQREEVAAYDEYRAISLRDEITVALNNFVELLQSDEVRQRTIKQLGLEDKDGSYMIAAERLRDADFVNVTVEAQTPALAAEIANTHVGIAIAYYGELRSKSIQAEKDLFAEQLRVAAEEFSAAEQALVNFRTQNGIFLLESQMATQQRLLEQLQLERDQLLLEQAITVNPTPSSATPVTTTQVIGPVEEVDKLIAQRRKELDQFTALAPQYNLLIQNVEQARVAYQHLLGKYNEAELKVIAVQAANFIQVIKPAFVPAESESSWPKLAVLALAGSLGLGVMLAFLLQYLSSFKTAIVTVPVSDHKTPSRGRRKTSTENQASEVPVSDQKAPSRGRRKTSTQNQVSEVPASDPKMPSREYAGRKLWKNLRNVFHRNPSYKGAGLVSSTDPDAEQESIAVQGQNVSTETKVA